MKKIFYLIVLLAANNVIFAQNCDPYIPMKEGAEFEQTNYNPKGKLQTRSLQKVIKKEGTGSNLSATISGIIYDSKDKQINTMDYKVHCKNGVFSVDLAGIVPTGTLGQYQGMKVTVKGDIMDLPSNPTVGAKLSDASLTVGIENGGMAIMTIKINLTNRTVVAKEQIITSAGTFDCYVFAYDIQTEMGGMFPMKISSSSKEWYAKNAGLVRQEIYSGKGKMTGYSELTKLVIP